MTTAAPTPPSMVTIEVPGRAVALALMAQMVDKAMCVDATPQDDTTWVFKVPATHADYVRQIVAKWL